jgi:uncharacterized membrane protein YhhN
MGSGGLRVRGEAADEGQSRWMAPFLATLIIVYLACAAVGVFASLTGRRGLLVVFKPLTTALLFLVVGAPTTMFGWFIDAGILFSLGGDVALLFPAKNAFLVGLAVFLGAHLSYIVAFARVAGGALLAPATLGCGAFMALASTLLLRRLWPATAGLRAPLVAYAIAISLTVATAFAASTAHGAGSLPFTGAVGASLFYVGDASLALDRFHRPIRFAPVLTLGVYWLGQLAIALAARAATP